VVVAAACNIYSLRLIFWPNCISFLSHEKYLATFLLKSWTIFGFGQFFSKPKLFADDQILSSSNNLILGGNNVIELVKINGPSKLPMNG
jgi:hypothetical protein